MAITIERGKGLRRQDDEQFGLECPYCGVYAHMTPESVPEFESLQHSRPKHVGIVYQCDACRAPVFLRFAVKQFREALSCYSNGNFNAFASMCRRAASTSFSAMGESGKLRAFDEVMVAQDIAEIDDDTFEPIKKVIFDSSEEEDLPLLSRAQAGILLEVLKDMFYQCFVRRGKLTRAIKVRRFFVQDGNGGVQSSA